MPKSKKPHDLIKAENLPEPVIACTNCEACCCRLEVLLITETGVPERYIKTDQWGGETMLRLADGWCAALDRNTHMCTIYEKRPLICREFTEGEPDCIDQRRDWLSA
jgi:Fe-S-cluster containining protein